MRRLAVLGALVALLIVGRSQASIIQEGVVTFAEDNDFEALYRLTPGGTTQVTVGDFLLAIAEFPTLSEALPASTNQYFNGNGSTAMLTAVSLLKVATVSGASTPTANFTFSQPTIAEWTSVLTAAGLTAAQAAALAPTNPTGAMFQIFEDGAVGLATTKHAPETPTQAAGLLGVSDGTLLYEFGFSGALGVAGPDEFFTTTTNDNNPGNGTDATDILQITSLDGKGAFDLLVHHAGPLLEPHNYLGADRTSPPPILEFTGPTDLQLVTSLDGGPAGAWNIKTDSDFYIQAVVPEPGSLLVFGLLTGLCAAGAGARHFLRNVS